MSLRVAIIGAGRIGTSLSALIKKRGHIVELYDSNPSLGKKLTSNDRFVGGAQFILLCIPSWATRAVLKNLGELSEGAVVASFAKGIEHVTLKSIDEVLEEIIPTASWAVIGGPLMAEELQEGAGGVAIIASTSKRATQNLTALFEGTGILVKTTSNVRGITLAGVLKNVYGILLGMTDGFGWGLNRKSWLATLALEEMIVVVEKLGGGRHTTLVSGGLADFIVTIMSPHSRHRAVGERLAKTGEVDHNNEGTASIGSLITLLKNRHFTVPSLLVLLSKIVVKPSKRQAYFEDFSRTL